MQRITKGQHSLPPRQAGAVILRPCGRINGQKKAEYAAVPARMTSPDASPKEKIVLEGLRYGIFVFVVYTLSLLLNLAVEPDAAESGSATVLEFIWSGFSSIFAFILADFIARCKLFHLKETQKVVQPYKYFWYPALFIVASTAGFSILGTFRTKSSVICTLLGIGTVTFVVSMGSLVHLCARIGKQFPELLPDKAKTSIPADSPPIELAGTTEPEQEVNREPHRDAPRQAQSGTQC